MADNYIETVKAKRQQAQLIKAIQTPRSSVIVSTQAGLGKQVDDALNTVVEALKTLESGTHDRQELAALSHLSTEIHALQTAIERQTVQLVRAVSKIELNPQIAVPEPTIINNQTSTNKTGLDLSNYKAHDLDDAPDGTQYIGFIAPDGKWYILHSNDSKNSMRYYFGNEDYDTAWSERYSHDYVTLSEAIRGVSA